MIRVVLPYHLRTLAGVGPEVELDGHGVDSLATLLGALEDLYPVLRGTIRDRASGARRPLLRFFACDEDLSHVQLDAPLPGAVLSGDEPLLIVGAIAGG